jgi:hypothetical protein
MNGYAAEDEAVVKIMEDKRTLQYLGHIPRRDIFKIIDFTGMR